MAAHTILKHDIQIANSPKYASSGIGHVLSTSQMHCPVQGSSHAAPRHKLPPQVETSQVQEKLLLHLELVENPLIHSPD